MSAIEIERSVLFAPLKAASGAVHAHSPVPALANLLLEPGEGRLHLTGGNYELQVSIEVQAPGICAGQAFTVSARRLQNVMAKLPEASVVAINLTDSRLRIEAGATRYSVNTLPAADYPKRAAPAADVVVSLPESALCQILQATRCAMVPMRDVRYYYAGVLLELGEDSVTAVATDRLRMALATVPLTQGCTPRQIILPRGAVDSLCGLLTSREDVVRLSVQDNQVACAFNGTELITGTYDGSQYYPDWRAGFAKERDRRFSVSRLDLHAALERMVVVLDAKVPGVQWTASGDQLAIDAMNGSGETAYETVAIEGFSGEDICMAFNAAYALDGIAAAQSEKIECAFDLAAQNMRISEPGFTYYLGSMRV
jgi:DNA polymerase-3 subunit beta